ncbi:Hypothetical protein, putative [Bodo saltans]|uniref:Centrosomal protein CEP104 N-terminal domain-containing protein n=1 Tax=Bodo saltans TaxID=75058 RepID=A0A0S4JLD8_BODSA|nr:Hypothetical protein, putative [Bodo saltans]|eukprot:CUG92333.1 Hypothetical protein, putative [Bodo saltans]
MTAQEAGPRIPYEIVYCSSEDEPFPVTELLKEDDAPGHRGWQTAKNPKYPQSLVLRFYGDVDLRQIQILSHECKIASKVEVRVFSLRDNGIDPDTSPNNIPSFRDVRFVKLGSVGFNSNEKSKYRSKERKTVHLKSTAYFLKLNFQKCHTNNFNTNLQVGVYSVVCCGYPLSQVPFHVDPAMVPPVVHQHDGQYEVDPRRSESAMSEHGLPPIQGARAGAHPNWQQQQQQPQKGPRVSSGYTPPVHGGYANNMQPGAVYGYHSAPTGGAEGNNSYDHQYYTPTAPSLTTPQPSRLPPIHAQGGYNKNVQFNTPNNKHNTAHPHDIPSIPDSQASNSGYTYRSQSIVDFDVIYSSRTEELVRLKAKAVDEEDFDEAKECKDALKHLHHAAQHLYELERQKVRCIYSEDFDEAKHFKNEMDQYLGDLYVTIPDGAERFLGGAPSGAPGGSSNQNSPDSKKYAKQNSAGPTSGARRRLSGGQERKGPIVEMPPIQQRPLGGAVGGGAKHNFEEEPVRSKYAIAMAQRREEHPSDDEGGDQGDEGAPTESAEYDPVNQSVETAGGQHHHNNNGNYEDDNVSAQVDDDANNISGIAIIDTFDVNSMQKWEQDVYKAIHAEAGDDTPAQPLPPNGAHVEAAECIRVLGNYVTACLLSKKWKLREAAIKALINGLPSPLYPNVAIPNVVQVILKFFEMKGYGLQDTIGNIFLVTCVFVQNTLQDRYECLNAVLPQVLNLLPRFISRAGDANQKTRDEAAATVLAFALSNEVGAHYVIGIILADPIDQDKRRIPLSNHRVQVARLNLWQQVLNSSKLSLTPSVVDASMNKLLIPCLNHNSNEVRDLAVSIVSTLLEGGLGSSLDLSKYVSQISNPTVKASLESKVGGSSSGGSSNSAQRSSAGKQRNTSATRQRSGSAGKQRNNSAPRKAQNRSAAPHNNHQQSSGVADDDDV